MLSELLTLGAALALTAPPPAPPRSAVVALVVNGQPKGDAIVQLTEGDVLVPRDDLLRGGLTGLPGGAVHEGVTYVELSSLSPRLAWRLDQATVTLLLEADASLFPTTVLRSPGERPEGLVRETDLSGFLNLAPSFHPESGFLNVYSEAGLHTGDVLFLQSVTTTISGGAVRGSSQIVFDEPDALRRWTLGDAFTSTGLLGGGAQLTGLTLARSFDLDPYFVRRPGLGYDGAVTTPSELDVWVDGVRIRSETLPPGPFRLADLKVPVGASTARFVLRDALGREQVLTESYHLADEALAPGVSEYAYSLGWRRLDYGRESLRYDRPVALGQHRVGLSPALTLGWRVELAPDLLGLGASLTASTPVGQLSLALSGSLAPEDQGLAAYLAWSFRGRGFGAALHGQVTTARYQTLSLPAALDRALIEGGGSVSAALGPLALSLVGRVRTWRDQGLAGSGELLAGAQLLPGLSLRLGGGILAAPGGALDFSVSATLTLSTGFGLIGTAALQHDPNGRTIGSLAASLSESGETGLGGQLGASLDADTLRGSGMLRGHTRYGHLLATVNADATGADVLLSGATGLAFVAGGGVFLTRPVHGSFAVVDPGVDAEVTVLHANREVARTSSPVLIPDLLPYYGNKLSVDLDSLPFDVELAADGGLGERLVAPGWRGGVLVELPLRRARYLRGRVVSVGEGAAPDLGEVTVRDHAGVAAILGRGGVFELTGLGQGSYIADVEHGEGRCVIRFEVGEGREAFVDLGGLRCEPEAGGP